MELKQHFRTCNHFRDFEVIIARGTFTHDALQLLLSISITLIRTHPLDVAHAPEARGGNERARRELGDVHALVAQNHVHVDSVDAVRHHHARFGGSDPFIHPPLRVPLQEGVQTGVPPGQEGPGTGPGHDGEVQPDASSIGSLKFCAGSICGGLFLLLRRRGASEPDSQERLDLQISAGAHYRRTAF